MVRAILVSAAVLHAGQPFEKRGETDVTLPTFDVPVSVLEWELSCPSSIQPGRAAAT